MILRTIFFGRMLLKGAQENLKYARSQFYRQNSEIHRCIPVDEIRWSFCVISIMVGPFRTWTNPFFPELV